MKTKKSEGDVIPQFDRNLKMRVTSGDKILLSSADKKKKKISGWLCEVRVTTDDKN